METLGSEKTVIEQPESQYRVSHPGRDARGRFIRDDATIRQSLIEIETILKILVKKTNQTGTSSDYDNLTGALSRLHYLIEVIDNGEREDLEEAPNALQEQEAREVDVGE